MKEPEVIFIINDWYTFRHIGTFSSGIILAVAAYEKQCFADINLIKEHTDEGGYEVQPVTEVRCYSI